MNKCLKKLTATKASVLAFCMVSKIYGIVPDDAKGPAMWKLKPATTIFQTSALAWYSGPRSEKPVAVQRVAGINMNNRNSGS
jgi:hypothetical protein